MVAHEFVEAVKMVAESRVPVQRCVRHKQGLRADPHYEETDHECHHARGRGEMADWGDVEDAGVREDPVDSLE